MLKERFIKVEWSIMERQCPRSRMGTFAVQEVFQAAFVYMNVPFVPFAVAFSQTLSCAHLRGFT